MSTKIATIPDAPIQVGDLMRHAIDKGVSAEELDKLVALHERIADRMATQEFAEALAQFQEQCPSIQRNSVAKITSKRTGTSFQYRYADLHEIASTANPILSRLGLSYSWDSEATDTNVRAVCTLRHRNGHSITASFSSPIDRDATMNSGPQQNAVALTYARRQSLVQVLGLTMTDPDTDAPAAQPKPITEGQAADLEALIEESGANRDKFLKWMGVPDVALIDAADYGRAVDALTKKLKKATA